jgi:hypothetical protein
MVLAAIKGLPLPRMFRQIIVAPAPRMYLAKVLPFGGPIWPRREKDPLIRFCRDGMPQDRIPKAKNLAPERFSRPCIWGGASNLEFGHIVAETLTRIPWSIALQPDYQVLVVLSPGYEADNVPDYFWEILDWWGVKRDNIVIVTKPLIVDELYVMPQAEQLRNVAPSGGFLDLLDANYLRSGLRPIQSQVLYVTRSGMIGRLAGGHLGESYLVDRLLASGVTVLDPATAPLKEQLAAYAGARHIIFAEGSAIHGRQLLGRIDQQITILTRRFGSRIGKAALMPRIRQLNYVDLVRRTSGYYLGDGRFLQYRSLAFSDTDNLLATFASAGVELRSGWSMDLYFERMAEDMTVWLKKLAASEIRIDHALTLSRLQDDLSAEGLGHLLDGPGAWIGQPVAG